MRVRRQRLKLVFSSAASMNRRLPEWTVVWILYQTSSQREGKTRGKKFLPLSAIVSKYFLVFNKITSKKIEIVLKQQWGNLYATISKVSILNRVFRSTIRFENIVWRFFVEIWGCTLLEGNYESFKDFIAVTILKFASNSKDLWSYISHKLFDSSAFLLSRLKNKPKPNILSLSSNKSRSIDGWG